MILGPPTSTGLLGAVKYSIEISLTTFVGVPFMPGSCGTSVCPSITITGTGSRPDTISELSKDITKPWFAWLPNATGL